MNLTRVRILTEDKTGGGHEAIIKAAVNGKRKELGKSALAIDPNNGFAASNSDLLKKCKGYRLLRSTGNRYHHVVYVVDARRSWEVCKLEKPLAPYSVESLATLIEQVRAHMRNLAQSEAPEWAELESGFHSHVLVWERESLMLPVAEQLGLGASLHDVYAEMQAFEWVRQRHQRYAKGLHGRPLLTMIAQSPELRALVLQSNSSLKAIVEDLVAID